MALECLESSDIELSIRSLRKTVLDKKSNDIIEINATNNTIQLHVDDKTLEERLLNLKSSNVTPKKGVLAKYKRLVGSASKGAITD